MNHEKKYKEALERAKSAIKECGDNKGRIAMIESIFPELKKPESEDERIRKTLLESFEYQIKESRPDKEWVCGVKLKEIVAWLEKQKSVGEIVERCKKSWYNEGKIQGMFEGITDDEKYQQGWHDALEKQGEQKPFDYSNANIQQKDFAEQKPAWSEEDKEMIDLLIAIFEVNYPNGFYKTNSINTINMGGMHSSEIIDWLKSLRPQKQWKPSKEQLKSLDTILYGYSKEGYAGVNEIVVARDLLNKLKEL